MDNQQDYWPEPIVSVQALSDSGAALIPDRFVKPPALRPSFELSIAAGNRQQLSIPTIDLGELSDGSIECPSAPPVQAIAEACRDWGFFQVVNHGVSRDLMRSVREVWRQFFDLPAEEKQAYANTPRTYEGYGSRTGVQKGALLDWGDYFYLYLFPESIRSHDKWPILPSSLRETVEEYGKELVKLSETLVKVLSISLGLEVDYIQQAFGGRGGAEASLRANYYPKCPQPELTLGLSPHSDPGGITILLADVHVDKGLQVLKDNAWVTVHPVPGALIVNLGDQVQVMSNSVYKSVEHRVLANSTQERISLAFFYNPKGDVLIGPATELVATPEHHPPLYRPMTFDEYRRYIRAKGPSGKSQLESMLLKNMSTQIN